MPGFERLVRLHGKLRLLFVMNDFDGWDAGAAWEGFKFGIEHFADIEWLAMVGETKWQHGMATFCKPFTTATVRYFDRTDAVEARMWLRAA
ncbi:MAG: STAS/SEC14 domain-containing protein [Candidatus Nitrotoga sp.]